jgi:hypothetical protein
MGDAQFFLVKGSAILAALMLRAATQIFLARKGRQR